jgi:hypothetical protein
MVGSDVIFFLAFLISGWLNLQCRTHGYSGLIVVSCGIHCQESLLLLPPLTVMD